ncbi:MAG TPA: HD domain-containing protein [Candidatus Nitrosocosmicus sp.]|nr:HD domain-containing protein [Candidatus Nitrosocosmicus sp.]
MISRQQALQIVEKNIPNKNLVKHCLCVEAAMKGIYRYLNPQGDKNTEEKWGLIGLLHDADWEVNRDTPHNHTRDTVKWLEESGENDQEIIRTILAHNHHFNGEPGPENELEWALYTCDELTGIIVATALMQPEKKLDSVNVHSVVKKLKTKSFAAAVDRNQIKLCEEKLGIPLEKFIEIILDSMKNIAPDIGL